MFVAQSVILGELVDYFTEVGYDQAVQCSFDAFGLNNTTAGVSHSSTVNAYLYSLGECENRGSDIHSRLCGVWFHLIKTRA